MTIDELIAVLQASKEGKTIQARYKFGDDKGWSSPPPSWDLHRYDYRVKPEPRELEAWFYHGVYNFSTLNLPECDRTRYINAGYVPTKFREVIE